MKTINELIVCAVQELAMRRRVYPNFILRGKMTKTKSDHEIECMERIAKVLKNLEDENWLSQRSHSQN